MKCPVCGAHGVHQNTCREVPYSYRGQKTMLCLHGDWCPECEEIIMDEAAGDSMEQQIEDFKRKVHEAGTSFVLKVREKLGLSREQAGELFGGGARAFTRYEEGKDIPPHELLVLLQILNRHPELLEEVRTGGDIFI